MTKVNLASTNHKFTKQNFVTINDKSGMYDKYQCELCGMQGKRYGLGGTLKIDGRTSKSKTLSCPDAERIDNIMVMQCTAMGKIFENLVPGSTHKVIDPPDGKHDGGGVWVMGVGEPVKLLHGEYKEVQKEKEVEMNLEKAITSPGLLTAKAHNEPLPDLGQAIIQIKAIQDGNPFYESALTLVRAADYALANAKTPRDAKDIADRLKGIEAYLSRLSVAKLASNQIVAQRLRIERAIGAMIDEDGEIKRGGDQKSKYPRVTLIEKYGIPKRTSSRWQKYSRLDPLEFEDWVTKNQETNELSGAWLLRIVEELDPTPPPVRTWESYALAALNSVDAMLYAPGVTQDIEDKGRAIVASLQWLLDSNQEVE